MEKVDKSGMRKVILDFPKQFKVGLEATKNIKVKGKFENIIVSGMGGSIWPTDILTTWINMEIPIYTNRTYNLPPQTNSKTLLVFSSYSGNTEELIYSYKEALKKGYSTISITSGGKLKKLCEKNKTPLVLLPSGLQPRMATGYLFSALAGILFKAGLINKKLTQEILDLDKKLEPKKFEKKGKQIAKKLFKKVPIIYTPDRFKSIGYVWKIKFNENSKIPAFTNYFSELNHNEMNGWQNPLGKFFVVILRDLKDHPRMLKRIKLTANLLKSKKIDLEIIDIPKGNMLSRIFNTLLLADWISYYLALEYKIDPVKVKMVEEFKKRL
jgi:glucose/mannose-6-phosphate isomerase